MALFKVVLIQLIITCWALMTSAEPPMADVVAVRQLADNIQTFVLNAKEGMLVSTMSQRINQLRTTAIPFLPDADIAEQQCETNTVLKMAAAATRSREVLSVLFANDTSALLSSRLSLAVASVDLVNQQLIEELTVTKRFQPQVAAFVIVAQTAESIINDADESLSAPSSDVKLDDHFYREEGGLAWRERASFIQFDLSPLQQIQRRRSAPLPLERQRRCWGGSRCWIGVGF